MLMTYQTLINADICLLLRRNRYTKAKHTVFNRPIHCDLVEWNVSNFLDDFPKC